MIQEIKIIVQNYLEHAKLCKIMTGVVEEDGIRVSDKLIIPMELVVGNLKKTVSKGDKIRMMRNHGGQQFYVLEVIQE